METTREPDVVIVGVGIMGAAAGWALARAGHRVTMLERFQVGHDRGSSHGRSRIVRLSYPEARYVRMAREALPLWRTLEREAGKELLVTSGGLDLGPRVPDHAAALAACGVEHEILEPEAAADRFPALALPDEPALYQPDAGIVRADRAWRAFVTVARAHGAALREGERVVEVRAGEGGVTVRTERGRIRAPVAVVAAGPWARSLLAETGIHLPVTATRETVAYFPHPERAPLPVVVEWGDPPLYALPSPGEGLKAGEHRAGPVADPEQEGAPDEASVRRVAAWVGRRFPRAGSQPHRAETCFYTNTDDESFVLKREGPIVVGSPCSGHGFKFAPLLGRRLADLASPS